MTNANDSNENFVLFPSFFYHFTTLLFLDTPTKREERIKNKWILGKLVTCVWDAYVCFSECVINWLSSKKKNSISPLFRGIIEFFFVEFREIGVKKEILEKQVAQEHTPSWRTKIYQCKEKPAQINSTSKRRYEICTHTHWGWKKKQQQQPWSTKM